MRAFLRFVGRMIVTLIVIAVGLYLAVLAYVFIKQRDMLYPAPHPGRTPAFGTLARTPDGTPVVFIAPPAPDAGLVVHFHGNAEEIADSEDAARLAQSAGLGFAAIEYPGYGLASGHPTERSMLAAARAGLTRLEADLGISRSRFVLSGQSLGTGVAVQMAKEGWGTRLALISPYTTLPNVAALAFPYLPVELLMHDRFDSLGLARSIQLPVLIIHGTNDALIPIWLGRELKAQFPHATMVEIPGGGHNGLWAKPEVRDAWQAFVAAPR